MTEELQKAKEMSEFKASDAKSIYSQPFVPSKSTKPLTESSNMVMHTELRLERRAMFDETMKKKEEERERNEAERRALQQAEEAKQIKELRRSLVHKPQPIQQHQPIFVHPSSKPLTIPIAPVLSLSTRLRSQGLP